jgi:hypothetical protein
VTGGDHRGVHAKHAGFLTVLLQWAAGPPLLAILAAIEFITEVAKGAEGKKD